MTDSKTKYNRKRGTGAAAASTAGFSLIEILVTMGIIGIVTMIILTAMGGNRDLVATKSAAREMTAALRLAQNSALSGHVVGSGQIPCYFTFGWDSGSYTVTYVYHTPDNAACNRSGTLVSRTLQDSVVAGSTGLVTFHVPFGLRGITGTTGIVLRRNGSDAAAHTVCVSAAGVVTEQAGTVCN